MAKPAINTVLARELLAQGKSRSEVVATISAKMGRRPDNPVHWRCIYEKLRKEDRDARE